ncbi:MAG: transporter substrate-binding protein, partial [Eubacteriales bacterium]
NKAGGINGCQIAYVEEDGASQPSTFAAKAEKLIDSDGVATIFGCWTSSSRKAVKPIVEDYDALLWYPVTSFESFHAMSIRGVTRLTRIIGLVLSVSAVVLMVLTLR